MHREIADFIESKYSVKKLQLLILRYKYLLTLPGERMRLASISAGWLSRLITIGCGLVNTRLLIELLGVNGFAAQSILISLAPWMVLLNFGVPKTVQNTISELRASGNSYASVKGTACVLAIFGLLLTLPVQVAVSWGLQRWVLADFDIGFGIVLITCAVFALQGFATIFTQILFAEHRPLWPNLAGGIAALLQCAILLVFSRIEIRDFPTILIGFLTPAIMIAICTMALIPIWNHFQLNWIDARLLITRSKGFAVFGVLSTATLSLDYMMLGLLLDGQDIAEYSLASKLFMASFSIHSVVLTAYWTKTADLFYSRQYSDLKSLVQRILIVGFIVVCGPALVLVMYSDWIVKFLSSNTIAALPISLVLMWSVYGGLRVWSDTYAMLLMSMNKVSILNAYIPMQACVSVVAQWILGSHFGASGVIGGIILSFILAPAWILPTFFYRVLKADAKNRK